MNLFIIRHAQSYNNALVDESLRVVDPKLTAAGRRQAEILASFLAGGTDYESHPCEGEPVNGGNGCKFHIDRLYCSAMHRALETAQAAGRALGLRPQVWAEIHEHGGMWLDHGDPEGIVGYPGMGRSEIASRFPEMDLPPAIGEEGWWHDGREGIEGLTARAARVAETLNGWGPSDLQIALVTHGDFGSHLLRAILKVPREVPVFFHHDNTGITRVRYRPNGTISLRYLNRLAHLPPELIT